MGSVELAATESRSISRSELVAYVDELSEWLQTEHQLSLRKACICVAVAQFELTAATLTTRKREVQSVVLAAARGELRSTASGAANSDGTDAYADREARAAERQRLQDRLAGPDGGLPWDALPIGNPDEDEENHAKALLVVGEYFADYREPLGQRLYDACMGKDTPENGKRKTRTNKEMRYQAYRAAAKELGYSARAPLGVFELIIKTRWPEQEVEHYVGYKPKFEENQS